MSAGGRPVDSLGQLMPCTEPGPPLRHGDALHDGSVAAHPVTHPAAAAAHPSAPPPAAGMVVIMGSLEGAHVLVVGASGGLGAAISRELVAAGARLTLSGRSDERLAALAAELGDAATDAAGGGVLGMCRAI